MTAFARKTVKSCDVSWKQKDSLEGLILKLCRMCTQGTSKGNTPQLPEAVTKASDTTLSNPMGWAKLRLKDLSPSGCRTGEGSVFSLPKEQSASLKALSHV